MFRTQDLRVKEIVRLLTPRELGAQLPVTNAINGMVAHSRKRIIRILRQEDPRLLVVIGPCSSTIPRGRWNTQRDWPGCNGNWPARWKS